MHCLQIPQYINPNPSNPNTEQQQSIENSINQSAKKQNPNFLESEKPTKMMIKIDVARKWREIAALGRKRISYPEKIDRSSEKGHFVVYASDGVRFSFPIGYLSCLIFRELLRMSEEEFGHPRNGPITLPCDSQVLRYVASLMEKKAAEEVEKAFLLSMADYRCSSFHYLQQQQQQQQWRHTLVAGC